MTFEQLAAELRNWGRWGPDDELGTLNLLGAAQVARAVVIPHKGQVFSLSMAFDELGVWSAGGPRHNRIHMMNLDAQDAAAFDKLLSDSQPKPIEEFTHVGVRIAEGRLAFDVIIFAAGFGAFTGALTRTDIRGRRTVTGGQVEGRPIHLPRHPGVRFPYLFLMGGPHGKGGHGNSPRCGEPVVEWLIQALEDFSKRGVTQSRRMSMPRRFGPITSWRRVLRPWRQPQGPGSSETMSKGRRTPTLVYQGALYDFVDRLDPIRENDYEGFKLS